MWENFSGIRGKGIDVAIDASASVTHVFVYGTLRRGSASPMAAWLADRAQWQGSARARGALYAIDGYPGFVPDQRGEWICGDLFALPDGDAGRDLLAAMDEYEECSARFPAPREYDRVVLDIDFAGSTVCAWTYAYAWSTSGRHRIMDGDFLSDRP